MQRKVLCFAVPRAVYKKGMGLGKEEGRKRVK
jgi:hypothetical protein